MLSDAPVCVIDREVGAVGKLRTAGLDYAKSRGLRELLRSHRIQHRVIPPRTPERNGALRSSPGWANTKPRDSKPSSPSGSRQRSPGQQAARV